MMSGNTATPTNGNISGRARSTSTSPNKQLDTTIPLAVKSLVPLNLNKTPKSIQASPQTAINQYKKPTNPLSSTTATPTSTTQSTTSSILSTVAGSSSSSNNMLVERPLHGSRHNDPSHPYHHRNLNTESYTPFDEAPRVSSSIQFNPQSHHQHQPRQQKFDLNDHTDFLQSLLNTNRQLQDNPSPYSPGMTTTTTNTTNSSPSPQSSTTAPYSAPSTKSSLPPERPEETTRVPSYNLRPHPPSPSQQQQQRAARAETEEEDELDEEVTHIRGSGRGQKGKDVASKTQEEADQAIHGAGTVAAFLNKLYR